jgi:putative endonuclease
MTWFVYIVECADGTLYTGITTDIERRLREHDQGSGARYTRGRGPVRLRYSEPRANRSEATRREREIKALPRAEKRLLGPTTGD